MLLNNRTQASQPNGKTDQGKKAPEPNKHAEEVKHEKVANEKDSKHDKVSSQPESHKDDKEAKHEKAANPTDKDAIKEEKHEKPAKQNENEVKQEKKPEQACAEVQIGGHGGAMSLLFENGKVYKPVGKVTKEVDFYKESEKFVRIIVNSI